MQLWPQWLTATKLLTLPFKTYSLEHIEENIQVILKKTPQETEI